MYLDHLEVDSSPFGSAMKWQAVLTNAPAFTLVKYKIGAWREPAMQERFADFNSGYDNQVFSFQLGTRGEPLLTIDSVSNGKLDANYTTSRFFIDEVAGDFCPMTVDLQPGEADITAAEVFSNLNRRDWSDRDGNGDGIADGIVQPDGNLINSNSVNQYYIATPMINVGGGHYRVVLRARKTGAYRLTARWKVKGDESWHWYANSASGRRDHAIVVSPSDARTIRLYEINALTVEASGASESQRSTFEDLYDGPGATHTNRWNLDYLNRLGCNWLWFQPIHPVGIEGRQSDPNTGLPYEPGSPYAIKNFFEVSPNLSRGGPRESSLIAFSNFVAAADAKRIQVMLDVPFNHTAIDCELASAGVSLLSPGSLASDEIRNREARFYSRNGNYAMRASSSGDIAVAPDRGDFGKWSDVRDVYFGNYAALVDVNPINNGKYLNEGDWLDTTVGHEGVSGEGNGHFDSVTRNVWRYFASYVTTWLDKTGYPLNPNHEALNSHAGIDGLRCDFGQGLPPQCWEYIINVARSRRWNFVFMSETLDGGSTAYRSNRHFDILNENAVFSLKNASQTADFRQLFEERRSAYGQGLVLLNTTSHDEEGYEDPWQAVVRMAVAGSSDGATMVFYGQELGASRTTGFESYELNFGKLIPNFKAWNSMMPAWTLTNNSLSHIYPVIAGINAARQVSPALRSSSRSYLNQVGGATHPWLWAVAKAEQEYASPASRDVVFAFANLDRNNKQSGLFDVNIASGGTNLFGIQPMRTYNVRNIAAYAGADAHARSRWLWAGDRLGSELLTTGIYVAMNAVPASEGAWATAPFEAMYMKLYDMTPPSAPGAPTTGSHYSLSTSPVFSWKPAAADADETGYGYLVSVGTTAGGAQLADRVDVGSQTHYSCQGRYGTTNYATVWAVSAAGITSLVASSSSATVTSGSSDSPVVLIAPEQDSDGDGLSNADEATAGTDPLDPDSNYRIIAMDVSPGVVSRAITTCTRPGYNYRIMFNDNGLTNDTWKLFGNTNNGVGSWVETNRSPTTHLFVDDETKETTFSTPVGQKRYYRIEVR